MFRYIEKNGLRIVIPLTYFDSHWMAEKNINSRFSPNSTDQSYKFEGGTMAIRDDLCDWVIEALNANGGRARIVEICKYIWQHHENQLRQSGDLFYTWQYDVRWAGQKLRDNGTLMPAYGNRGAPWELKRK